MGCKNRSDLSYRDFKESADYNNACAYIELLCREKVRGKGPLKDANFFGFWDSIVAFLQLSHQSI